MWPCLIWLYVHYSGKQGGARREMNCGWKDWGRIWKIQRFFFFNEHSMQKAWTQASAIDIIRLAGEDPVNCRGRQRQSLPRQPAFEAAADSLLFSCCCIHPPSFALSLSLTDSLTLSHSFCPSGSHSGVSCVCCAQGSGPSCFSPSLQCGTLKDGTLYNPDIGKKYLQVRRWMRKGKTLAIAKERGMEIKCT